MPDPRRPRINASVQRSSDVCARYGGEEFIILLPQTTLASARAVAEEVRNAIEAIQLRHDYSDAAKWVTISCGVACCVPRPGDSSGSLIGKMRITHSMRPNPQAVIRFAFTPSKQSRQREHFTDDNNQRPRLRKPMTMTLQAISRFFSGTPLLTLAAILGVTHAEAQEVTMAFGEKIPPIAFRKTIQALNWISCARHWRYAATSSNPATPRLRGFQSF
jgi:predicted signal transduction protein with EAL and GGDEF domain